VRRGIASRDFARVLAKRMDREDLGCLVVVEG
jgi:hypothetical protein